MKQSSCVRNLGPNMWLFAGFNGGERESCSRVLPSSGRRAEADLA